MACVLFVCLHNAGRSQVSQALFERSVEAAIPPSRPARTQPGAFTPEVVHGMRHCPLRPPAETPPLSSPSRPTSSRQ